MSKRIYLFQLIAGSTLGYIIGLILCNSLLNSIAFGLTGFYITRLILDLGSIIPIDSFILSLASMQWLLGPALTYSGYSNHATYYMYEPEQVYYPYAMSGVILLHLGLSLLVKRSTALNLDNIEKKIREQLSLEPNLPFFLIGLGVVSSIITRFTPASLFFLTVLLGNISYIGVIYLLYSNNTLKWWGVLIVVFLLFLSSLSNGLFHDLLLWLSFIAFYIAKINKVRLRSKILFVALGLGLAVIIQMVKTEYRKYVWSGYGGNKVSLFIDLASKEVTVNESEEEYHSRTESIIVRLNQGWIISRIMSHIPAEEGFIHGQSIKNAIYGGIVPRLFDPDKEKAGGQDYFKRITGLELINGTSMGASLLGEGYANFGDTGGLIFIFIYGLFIGWVLRLIYKLARKYPTLILWLPFLFLQVVKAESDLLRVFNHLIKAALIVYLMYWFFGKQLKWKI